ncbi:DUF2185 domain-containing protein [Lentzea sp. NBRC 105346]|uniref:DUF2185 domain-containing protein n=1 Tax=Lentzea sp. NBRC 105346 TaxID=3032205 RepID=UPI0025558320|nr:DUF2185 domain-containing protein [Lentzea sp. NBRC 105346]
MTELLGSASFPSGDLLLIDFGLLRLWSGDQPPLLPEELAPPVVVAKANAAADFEIVGPQAAEAAARLSLAAVKGRYVFDVPQDGDPVVEAVALTGLEATVRQVPRMPHYTRVQRLLDDLPGGAEVPFHGGWGVAVRGLPAGPLRVLGERMEPGPDQERWHSVWVECAEGVPAESIEAGYVLVDEARLMFADPAALNTWVNDEPVDGLFDLAFWGADAEQVATRLAGSKVEDEYLWADLTFDEMRSRYHQLESLRGDGVKFAFDLRPHDDHYRLLKPMRSSATESGDVEVGGALMTGWFTSWGDGAFPVYRDLAEDGTLLRVRVELGAPEIVARQRRFERLYFGDLARMAIVSARVARDGAHAAWLYREEPGRDEDSGWRVFAGDETQEYADDASNATILPLRELIGADPALEAVFDQPPGSAFERVDGEFVPAED